MMKRKICIVVLLTIGIVTSLVLFFEQYDANTTDVFDGALVYRETSEIQLL